MEETFPNSGGLAGSAHSKDGRRQGCGWDLVCDLSSHFRFWQRSVTHCRDEREVEGLTPEQQETSPRRQMRSMENDEFSAADGMDRGWPLPSCERSRFLLRL